MKILKITYERKSYPKEAHDKKKENKKPKKEKKDKKQNKKADADKIEKQNNKDNEKENIKSIANIEQIKEKSEGEIKEYIKNDAKSMENLAEEEKNIIIENIISEFEYEKGF